MLHSACVPYFHFYREQRPALEDGLEAVALHVLVQVVARALGVAHLAQHPPVGAEVMPSMARALPLGLRRCPWWDRRPDQRTGWRSAP